MKKYIIKNDWEYLFRPCYYQVKCSGGCDCTRTIAGEVIGTFSSGKEVIYFTVLPKGKDPYYRNEVKVYPDAIKFMPTSQKQEKI